MLLFINWKNTWYVSWYVTSLYILTELELLEFFYLYNFIIIVLVIILGVNVLLPIIVYGWPLYYCVYFVFFLHYLPLP